MRSARSTIPPASSRAQDVDALRALAFAPTRGSSLHVDRDTAEALFDIAHATALAPNAPEFADFFAKAVGNYLMGASFLGTPDRDAVLRHEAELDKPSGFGAFFAAMAGGPSLLKPPTPWNPSRAKRKTPTRRSTTRRIVGWRPRATSGTKTPDGFSADLSRGGSLSDAERALLGFLKSEAASAPPELAAWFDKAA